MPSRRPSSPRRPRPRAVLPAATALLLAVAASGCTSDGPGSSNGKGTPGAHGLRDPLFPKLGNGGYDVSHYALDLDYDPVAHRLKGTAEITARATQDLSAFNLDLSKLKVDSATVEGEKAAANQAGTELTLRPRRDLRKGETFTTVVRYSGEPQRITNSDRAKEGWLRSKDGKVSVAVGQPTGSMAWFPGNHHPSDKATYDIKVTVPKNQTAISNGELKNPPVVKSGRKTFDWQMREPMASYLATLVVGKFEVTKGEATAELEADEVTASRKVPVYAAAEESVAAASAELLGQIPEMMDWAVTNFGPYPFSSTGGIVLRGTDIAYALETQTKPVYQGVTGTDSSLEGAQLHEIVHQWFGNSVSPKSWRDMWLNESFATYAEWMWEEDQEGYTAQESFEAAFDEEANWAFPPASPPDASQVSAAPMYGRGAMVLHKIRQKVADDEAFLELIQGWAAGHRHSNASTADFTKYVEEKTHKDLSAVWDVWLNGDEKPTTPNG